MVHVNTITIFYIINNEHGYSVFDGALYDLQDAINHVLKIMPEAKLIDYKID